MSEGTDQMKETQIGSGTGGAGWRLNYDSVGLLCAVTYRILQKTFNKSELRPVAYSWSGLSEFHFIVAALPYSVVLYVFFFNVGLLVLSVP